MHSHIYILLLLIPLCIAPHMLSAQSCNINIRGHVTDQHDDQPLAYATIYFEEAEKGIVSDSAGYFLIQDLCPGTYHISVSHIGCETSRRFISIQKDTTLILYLEHHDELLAEVEIKGLPSTSKAGSLKTSLTGDLLLALKGKTLAEMLTALPGMQVLGSGPGISKPVIQGLTGNRIMIFNNGLPVEGQQWGNDHTPELNPDVADNISVIRGMASVRYGSQAVGGVITIDSENTGYDPHWHGFVRTGFNTNGRGLGLHGYGKRSTDIGNISLHGGYNLSGDHHTPEYYLTNTGNKNHFFSLQVSNNNNSATSRKLYFSHYYNQNGILRAAHSGNLTDLNEAFTRKVPLYTDTTFGYRIVAPRQHVLHHTLSYRQSTVINDENVLHFEGGIQSDQRKEFDVRRGQRSDVPSLDLLLISGFSDIYLTYAKHPASLQHTLGLQTRYRNNTNVPGTGIRPLIPDYINFNSGMYYILKKSTKKATLEFGVRGEYRNDGIWSVNNAKEVVKSERNYITMASNGGFKYKLGSNMDTYIDISYTRRPPEINELFASGLHQGLGSIEQGNSTLTAEKSWRISNDWQGHVFEKLHIHSTLFYSRTRDFIYLQPSGELRLTIRGAFPVFEYLAAPVEMMGLNIRTTSDIGSSFQLSTALNLLKTTNLNTGTGLPYMPPYHGMVQFSYTIGKTRYFNECKIGMDANYYARQNNVNPDEDFLPPPDSYLLSNANITIKWKAIRGKSLNTYIQIDNLWNTVYRDYMNRLRYFAQETGRNISASFQLNF
jgi:iron complex outermembrane receptor protein